MPTSTNSFPLSRAKVSPALLLELVPDGEDYEINYKIAYLKGDSVRFIGGTHTIA